MRTWWHAWFYFTWFCFDRVARNGYWKTLKNWQSSRLNLRLKTKMYTGRVLEIDYMSCIGIWVLLKDLSQVCTNNYSSFSHNYKIFEQEKTIWRLSSPTWLRRRKICSNIRFLCTLTSNLLYFCEVNILD